MFGPFVGVGLRAYSLAKGAVEYLFRDEFTTAEAAPITSPRTCEPGPGTIEGTESSGSLSIADGQLLFTGASASYNDPKINSSVAYAQSAGLMFYGYILDNPTTGYLLSAAVAKTNPNATSAFFINFTGNRLRFNTINTDDLAGSFFPGHLIIITRDTGAFFITKGAAESDYTIRFISNTGNGYDLYFVASCYSGDFKAEEYFVAQLPAPFNTDNGIATDTIATPAAGNTFSHEADCIIEFTVDTLPSAGGDISVRFRQQDQNNEWAVNCATDGRLYLYEFVSGSPTSRGSGGVGTVTNGARIVAIIDDTNITVYVNDSQIVSYLSASNFKTQTNGDVHNLGTGGAISNLKTWPRTLSGTAATILDQYTA